MMKATGSLLHVLYACLFLVAEGLGNCDIDECYTLKDASKQNLSCERVDQIIECMNKKKKCKGDINYHAVWASVGRIRKNCTHELEISSELPEVTTLPPREQREIQYSYCSMYGNVHVKTWSNRFRTCKQPGALPLISSPLLDIQVTFVPYYSSNFYSISTSTIHLRKREQQNFLEINSNSSIDSQIRMTHRNHKNLFTYNVTRLGKNREKAELYMPHIETTLIIRKSGSLLGFTLKMPNRVLSTFDTSLGHCFSDFPCQSDSSENALYTSDDWKLCVERGLNEPFITWCATDLYNHREPETVMSAVAAQNDLLAFDSRILDKIEAEPLSSSQSLRPRAFVIWFAVIVTWFSLSY